MSEPDPRAKWRHLPHRMSAEETIAETDVSLADSTTAADADAAQRETRWLFERGGGMGG